MRCPKCNFVSFDHLDKCKKCGNSLEAVKLELGWTLEVPGPISFFEDKLTAKETELTGFETKEPEAVVDVIEQSGEEATSDLEMVLSDEEIQGESSDDLLTFDDEDASEPSSPVIEELEIDKDEGEEETVALDLSDALEDETQTELSMEADNEEVVFDEATKEVSEETSEIIDHDESVDLETLQLTTEEDLSEQEISPVEQDDSVVEEMVSPPDQDEIVTMDVGDEESTAKIYDQVETESEKTADVASEHEEDMAYEDDEEVLLLDEDESADETLVYNENHIDDESGSQEFEISDDEEETLMFEEEGDEDQEPITANEDNLQSDADETMVLELDEGEEIVLTDGGETPTSDTGMSVSIEEEDLEEDLEEKLDEDLEEELVFELDEELENDDEIETSSTLSVSQEKLKDIAKEIDSLENDENKDSDEDMITLVED